MQRRPRPADRESHHLPHSASTEIVGIENLYWRAAH
jgi:hypothetical protein